MSKSGHVYPLWLLCAAGALALQGALTLYRAVSPGADPAQKLLRPVAEAASAVAERIRSPQDIPSSATLPSPVRQPALAAEPPQHATLTAAASDSLPMQLPVTSSAQPGQMATAQASTPTPAIQASAPSPAPALPAPITTAASPQVPTSAVTQGTPSLESNRLEKAQKPEPRATEKDSRQAKADNDKAERGKADASRVEKVAKAASPQGPMQQSAPSPTPTAARATPGQAPGANDARRPPSSADGYESMATHGGATATYKHEVIAVQGSPDAPAAAWVKVDDLKTVRASVGTAVPGLGTLVRITGTHAEFDSGRKLPLPLKKGS